MHLEEGIKNEEKSNHKMWRNVIKNYKEGFKKYWRNENVNR
jgi:hypothetical protein